MSDTVDRYEYEDAIRGSLVWRRKYEDLWDAVEALWWHGPGEPGYEEARARLERVWREGGGV